MFVTLRAAISAIHSENGGIGINFGKARVSTEAYMIEIEGRAASMASDPESRLRGEMIGTDPMPQTAPDAKAGSASRSTSHMQHWRPIALRSGGPGA